MGYDYFVYLEEVEEFYKCLIDDKKDIYQLSSYMGLKYIYIRRSYRMINLFRRKKFIEFNRWF